MLVNTPDWWNSMPTHRLKRRTAVTLLELIIVLAIIGGMASLLLPAVQSAREKSRTTVCKNNLHQLSLAMVGYRQTHRGVPEVGRWTVEILPWMEQQALADAIMSRAVDPQQFDERRPVLFHCPSQWTRQETSFESCHYVFVIHPDVTVERDNARVTWSLQDRQAGLSSASERPWYVGPELGSKPAELVIETKPGPHQGGAYHVVDNQASVKTRPRTR